jgi:FKBP-type peptidyl-prolyl cis-trans isomerase FkpA
MRTLVLTAALLGATMALAAPKDSAPKDAAPKEGASGADNDKTLYALGASIGRSLSVFSLSKAELEAVKRGLTDAVTNQKLAVDVAEYQSKIQELARSRGEARAKVEKEKSAAFLDKASKEKGAQKMPSGLIYVEQKAGNGESPKATDSVKVHYKGTLIDGTEFDSSYKRGQPTEFPLSNVIRCWTEGVQKMKPGGKAKLVCPSSIAYGDTGTGNIPGGATLVFEIELLEVAPHTK